MNGQVEVTWRTLRTVSHSIMVHARVPEVYVHFALMYTTDHIFPVLFIKDLINKDGDPTTPHKLHPRRTFMFISLFTVVLPQVYYFNSKLRRLHLSAISARN